MSSIDTEI